MTGQFPGNEYDPIKNPEDVVQYSRERLVDRVIENAITNVKAMECSAWQVSALIKIASALAQMGQEEHALTTLQVVQTTLHRAEVLAHIIPHLAEPWKNKAFDLLISLAPTVENRSQYAMVLAVALPSLQEPLQTQIAEQVFTASETLEYPFDILLKIAPYLPKASFPKVFSLAQRTKVTAPLPRTLAVMALRAEEPLRQQILDLALTMLPSEDERTQREIEVQINSHPKVLAFKEVLTALAHSGHEEKALRMARLLTNSAVRAQVLTVLTDYIKEPQKHRILKEALSLAQSYNDAYARAKTLMEIAPFWTEPMRQQIFEQALLAAQSIEYVYDQGSALAAVVPYLLPEARQQALKTAQSIQNVIAGGWALTTITPYFPGSQQKQLLAQVLESAYVLTDIFYRNDLIQRVASSLAKVGQLEQAFTLAQTIPDQTSQTLALANIVATL